MNMLGLSLGLPYNFPSGGGGGGTAPATPANFTATAGDQLVTLAWDASAGATQYKVYIYATNDFGLATQIAETPTASLTVDNIYPAVNVGNVFYYWVVASNGAGDSAPSTSANARPYITIADSTSVGLNTPTGTWTLATLFFRSGGALPADSSVTYSGNNYLFDGVNWVDDFFEIADALSISGSFTFVNNTGSSVTFWDAEP